MSPDFSDGLVLRLVPYGDADQIASLYTRAHGRISALARGARRSKRRFGGALGALVVSQFGLRPRGRGELWTLESAQLERDFTALAADVAAFAHTSYALELIGALTPAEAPDPGVLDLAIGLHEHLAAEGASAAALRRFELGLLELLGSSPVLEACASCGGDLGATGVLFDPARGGAVCAACAAASRGAVRPLPAGARAYLLAIRTGAPAAADADDQIAARDAMLAMLTHLVGRPLRTVEFIGKLRR